MEYVNGEFISEKDHAYYYQFQLRMILILVKTFYFLVYSRESLLYQMILFDEAFLSKKGPVAKNLFVYAILAELLGLRYSRTRATNKKFKKMWLKIVTGNRLSGIFTQAIFQRCFNVVDQRGNNIDTTLKMEQNPTLSFQCWITLIQRQ